MKTMMRFDGGADLARNLAQLSTRLSRKIQREALEEAAEPMRRRMDLGAPRSDDAPHAADTMTISNARGQDAREVAVAVGPSKAGFYLSFQELGTAHNPAQPFARPAFDEVSPQSLRILSAALWREMAGRGIARSVSAPTTVQGEEV